MTIQDEMRTVTFGQKLKTARKSAGLTQEQLAEKLMVSRQAITKWESDKGMPDIDNLKSLSQLLNVTIDSLLDNGESMDFSVLREGIDLDSISYKRKWTGRWVTKTGKKDILVRAKYPNAQIQYLVAQQTLTRWEKAVDYLIGFLTTAPFGVPQFINSLKNTDKDFYLVDDGERQLLVMVTDEFMESRHLMQKVTGKRFSVGDFQFAVSCTLPQEILQV